MFDNMGNEFRGGVCGGRRWNIPAAGSTTSTPFGFSPCLAVDDDDNMKGIFFSKSTNTNTIHDDVVVQNDIFDSTLHQMFGINIMEDNHWTQTFNIINGGGGGSRTNHQSQIQLQEQTMMCSSSLSDNLHDNTPQHLNSSLQFKSFSVDESNINNTTQHTIASFDIPNNMSYGYNSSKLLQTLFQDDDDDQDLLHESIFENPSLPINYPCTNNSRVVSPPIPKRPFDLISDQAPPLWNAPSVASLNDIANNFFPSSSSTSLMSSSMVDNLSFPKVTSESCRGLSWSSPMKKNNMSDQQPLKRSRMETPSPLPTFKVRKEKLGDRITALQQLVSPFGKTDTASVLHEAIDYIKFLHNQVNVLSGPYSRKGKNGENTKNETSYVVEEEGTNSKYDLKSRGLCLVPLSSTIPVAIETTRAADFWTPNFGGGFR